MSATLPLRLAGVAASSAAVLALAACGSTSSENSPSGSGGGTPVSISAKNLAFNPTTLAVPAGAKVTLTFSNQDSTEHSVTLDNGGGEVEAEGGDTKSFSFTAPQSGTLAFHCKYHPTTMKGTITVGASGGAAPSDSSSSSSSDGVGY
jgi:plastocyanin